MNLESLNTFSPSRVFLLLLATAGALYGLALAILVIPAVVRVVVPAVLRTVVPEVMKLVR